MAVVVYCYLLLTVQQAAYSVSEGVILKLPLSIISPITSAGLIMQACDTLLVILNPGLKNTHIWHQVNNNSTLEQDS